MSEAFHFKGSDGAAVSFRREPKVSFRSLVVADYAVTCPWPGVE